MEGPFELGTFSGGEAASEGDVLKRGQSYTVQEPFVDAAGSIHAVGEPWTFLGDGFNRFEDELWIWVRMNEKEWRFCLVWVEGYQLEIIEHFSRYVAAT